MKSIRRLARNILFKYLVRFIPISKSNINQDVGICSLLCHSEVDKFIYCITSFFFFSKKTYPIFVIDDGTLTKKDKAKLHRLFTITIESNSESKVSPLLAPYSSLTKFRFSKETYVLKKKFDALLLCPFKKYIYMDSDLLFYQNPEEIIEWISSNSSKIYVTARDLQSIKDIPGIAENHFSVRRLLHFIMAGRKIVSSDSYELFNSGLMCIPNKSVVDMSRLDKNIALLDKFYYTYDGLAEETSLGLLMREYKATVLPEKQYAIVLLGEDYIRSSRNKVVCRHYSGGFGMKAKFETEAIKLILKNKFFQI